jgi:hypothetical protein
MAVNRPPFFVVAVGLNGAGAITVAGAKIGDIVTSVNLTTPATTAANAFEAVVSVDGQVQQSSASNLSGLTYAFLLFPQGWKSIQ